MEEAPLSVIMLEHSQTGTTESYDRFLAMFRASVMGILTQGTPVQGADGRLSSDGTLGVARTRHSDGRSRIMTFADPEVFLRNFGHQFNAGIHGEVLLRMAADNADCEGILVNSALHEISIVIGRETAQWLLSNPDPG